MGASSLLCLITDRRRLGTAAGAPPGDWSDLLVEQVAAAGTSGIDMVQIRERDLEAGPLLDLVRRARTALAGTPTRLLVNDRVDVAVAAGIGVHLREDSIPTADARRLLGPGALIIRSVHDPRGATLTGADLLLAAPVFATSSKPPTAQWLGVEGLKAIVDAAKGTPVLALGGIIPANVGALCGVGVAGVAAIGAFIPSEMARMREIIARATQELRIPV